MNARLQAVFERIRYGLSLSKVSINFLTRTWSSDDQTYPLDNQTEWGRSDFDVRHNWTMSIWELPFFRDRNEALGGWQIRSGRVTPVSVDAEGHVQLRSSPVNLLTGSLHRLYQPAPDGNSNATSGGRIFPNPDQLFRYRERAYTATTISF
jgi:hypothetical protein